MDMFTNCRGECVVCKFFYMKGSCLAGHGDDWYEPADKVDVLYLSNKGETQGGRKLSEWEIKMMKDWAARN